MWTEFILLCGPIVNDIKCLQWLDEKWMRNAQLWISYDRCACRGFKDNLRLESSATQIHLYSFVSYTFTIQHNRQHSIYRCYLLPVTQWQWKTEISNIIESVRLNTTIYNINDNVCSTLHSINRFICLILCTYSPFQGIISLNNAAQIMYFRAYASLSGTGKGMRKNCCQSKN